MYIVVLVVLLARLFISYGYIYNCRTRSRLDQNFFTLSAMVSEHILLAMPGKEHQTSEEFPVRNYQLREVLFHQEDDCAIAKSVCENRNQLIDITDIGWMHGWIDFDFTSFSTVFQAVCNGSPFTGEKISLRAQLELRTARSAGQRLTH